MNSRLFGLALCLGFASSQLQAQSGTSGPLTLSVTNGVKTLTWPRPLIPALETNQLAFSLNLNNWNVVTPELLNISTSGYAWSLTNGLSLGFFSLKQAQLSSNALLSANILNRVAYGSTPDDLERIAQIGPQAYLNEQLAPEALSNPVDDFVSVATNGVTTPPPVIWNSVTVTGTVSSSTLYMYLRGPGELYMDDVALRYSYVVTAVTNTGGVITTNVSTNITANLLINGDFEAPLSPGWNVENVLAGSHVSPNFANSGASSLRMISTGVGTTQGSSIWQTVPGAPVTTRGTNQFGQIYTNTISTLRSVLSFSYIPTPNSSLLTLRLSGNGVIISGQNATGAPEWIYATATGTANNTPTIYLYLSGAGEGYIDDLKLVAGSVAGVGQNLIPNGDFESTLSPPWQLTADFANSVIDNTISHSGNGSLRLVATAAGGGNGDSIFQNIAVANGQTYTVSYWYRPATANRTLTVRLSGSLLASTPDNGGAGLKRRLDDANWGVNLNEMRTWFGHNAVGSSRQLLEILTQFFENHFVTYHSKTADYFDRYYDGSILDRIATDLEYREVSRWRTALLNPNCTFFDLLKIHVESPAQIIYLDTVESRGDGTRIANENYARELFELFTMGVDNGYDQDDIVAMSRAWTGWTVDIVDRANINNPFAPRSQQYGQYPGVGFNQVSNIVGVWSFVYNTNWHGTNRTPFLSVYNPNTSGGTNPIAIGPKVYPPRMGPGWAGKSYQISLPRRTANAGIQDGYDVIAALSTNLFTAEYLSVKLCRIFVHDEFPSPTTTQGHSEYDFYDYANPNRSAEAELVRRCIAAWDTPAADGRKGNIRSVLRTIFDSDLFRSHAGSRQKVKTPLEFVVSAVRALKSVNANGIATAVTDGNFSTQLSRMGAMSLFNRADPDGYPESGPPWISAGTLAERLRFVQALAMDPTQSGGRPSDAGNNTIDPVDLLQRKLPSNRWTDPGAVADLFVGYLYPGEGRANLDQYRQAAVAFLNDGSADPSANNTATQRFNQLTVSGSASSSYDLRVRGMVAMLMTLQRFQEQ